MTKETVVLLPGYDGDGQGTFAKLSQLLRTKYRCIIINYPYYLQTSKSYSLSELIDHVRQQIKKKGNEKFHMLGFSMGGFLASAYVSQYPEDIVSLTLVSSSVRPNVTKTYQALIILAYYAFKVPFLARLFSTIYSSPLLSDLVKNSPLPLPRDNFPSREAYPLFGTLANVLYESSTSDTTSLIAHIKQGKSAILFADDTSFREHMQSF